MSTWKTGISEELNTGGLVRVMSIKSLSHSHLTTSSCGTWNHQVSKRGGISANEGKVAILNTNH